MSLSINPIVSVIIPCYNYGRFLPACLNSLINQKFKQWECILVNNGSSDNTSLVCKQFIDSDQRFIYLETENKGPSSARNEGIRIAKGKFIQFLDADDLLEENKLNHQIEILERDESIDLVYGDARYFTTENPESRFFSMKNPDKKWMPEISGKGNVLIRALIKYNIMSIHAPLFRSSLIARVGLFDESLKGYEDWDYWLRMSLHNCSFEYSSGIGTLALIRSHPGSLNKNILNMRRYLLAVWWKCMMSGKLPIVFFPYVLLRTEEEFLITLKDGFIQKDLTLIGGESLSGITIFFMVLILPLFIPFILLVWLYRKLK